MYISVYKNICTKRITKQKANEKLEKNICRTCYITYVMDKDFYKSVRKRKSNSRKWAKDIRNHLHLGDIPPSEDTYKCSVNYFVCRFYPMDLFALVCKTRLQSY